MIAFIVIGVIITFSFQILLIFVFAGFVSTDKISLNGSQDQRAVHQSTLGAPDGVDFTGCVNDPETGLCCVEKDESVKTLKKDPILECTHKNVEKCHYTYLTQFSPTQEEVCEENFEKTCQITFKQQAMDEKVRKCYRPLEKVCDGSGAEQCRTVFESSCTTKYIEKEPGKFVGDTKCEKLPVEICGAGCTMKEGPEECHDKVITTLIDIPEETCDLNPQKTCRFQTKLIPKLKPIAECTTIPKEVCTLKFTQPEEIDKALKTKWCLDPTSAKPDDQNKEPDDQESGVGIENNDITVTKPTPQTMESQPQFLQISPIV